MVHVLLFVVFIIGGCFGGKEITGDILYMNTYLQTYMNSPTAIHTIFLFTRSLQAHNSKDRQIDVSSKRNVK